MKFVIVGFISSGESLFEFFDTFKSFGGWEVLSVKFGKEVVGMSLVDFFDDCLVMGDLFSIFWF